MLKEIIDLMPVLLVSIDTVANSFSGLNLIIKILILAAPVFMSIFAIIICRTFYKKSRKRGDELNE